MRLLVVTLGALASVAACSSGGDFKTTPLEDAGAGGAAGAQSSSGGRGTEADASATGGVASGTGGRAGTGGRTGTGGLTGTGGNGAGVGGAVVVSDGSVGPTTWCDSQDGLFCEDFDRFDSVDTFLNSWSTFSQVGGQFGLEEGIGVPSSPNALKVTTTSPTGVQTLVVKTLPAFVDPPSRIRLEFSLRIDAASDVGFLAAAAFAGVMMGDTVGDGVVSLTVGNGPTLVAAYIAPTGAPAPALGTQQVRGAFPAMNRWSGHYVMEMGFVNVDGSRVGCMQLLVANLPQLASCLPLPPSLSSPTVISVAFGVYSAQVLGNTGQVTLQFDNVLLTAE